MRLDRVPTASVMDAVLGDRFVQTSYRESVRVRGDEQVEVFYVTDSMYVARYSGDITDYVVVDDLHTVLEYAEKRGFSRPRNSLSINPADPLE